MGHSRHVDGHNDLVDTTVDVDEYNTPRLLILISAVIADRSAALAPSTVLAHPHLTEDSCLLRAACLSAGSKYRFFSSPSRGNSKQGPAAVPLQAFSRTSWSNPTFLMA